MSTETQQSDSKRLRELLLPLLIQGCSLIPMLELPAGLANMGLEIVNYCHHQIDEKILDEQLIKFEKELNDAGLSIAFLEAAITRERKKQVLAGLRAPSYISGVIISTATETWVVPKQFTEDLTAYFFDYPDPRIDDFLKKYVFFPENVTSKLNSLSFAFDWEISEDAPFRYSNELLDDITELISALNEKVYDYLDHSVITDPLFFRYFEIY